MKHFTSPKFWEHYNKLPSNIHAIADKNFELLKKNQHHPSLHLKKVNQYWSFRVGLKYRALALEISENLIWFWIGNHTDYERLIEQNR